LVLPILAKFQKLPLSCENCKICQKGAILENVANAC